MCRLFHPLWVTKLVALLVAFLATTVAFAEPSPGPQTVADQRPVVRFGVLAFRSKPETLKRWQPVAEYLEQKIQTHRFILEPLDYPDLDQAIRTHQVDLVLTQPAHYVALSIQENLYSPLATLVETQSQQQITQFGGVILTLAHNEAISQLSDLKGKRIAVSSKESLGGYQAQAFELLEAGVSPRQFEVLETIKQDAVLTALINSKADAGFIRTGLLEQMEQEGKIDLAQFKILKAERVPDYPLLLSTHLYPQWALAAMPWLNNGVAKQIAGAVLAMPANSDVANAANINGFTIPGDYRSVDRLMRTLRIPPFDQRIPLQVIWEDYRPLAMGILALLGLYAAWTVNIRLREHHRRKIDSKSLHESEQHFRTLANGGSALIWTADTNKLCDYFNEPWLRFTGRTLEQELGNGWIEGVHPDDLDACLEIYTRHFDRHEPFSMEYRLRHADGGYRWIIDQGNARFDTDGMFIGYIGVCYDITERKNTESQLRQAASVFNHANEGILITDPEGAILDVNATFTRITGYERHEVLGQNPRILNSGLNTPEFYMAMWQSLHQTDNWSGEIWNRRKNGEAYAELATITAIRDEQNEILRYVALFSDITPLKEQQKQLEHIAHYDPLTQLPNRLLLADRMHQAIVQAQRRHNLIAVAYIDLDGFKNVNDRYGHLVGDHLLIQVSENMKQALRDGDTLARLGGDEFVAVLLDLESHEASVPILDRLLNAAAWPVQTDGLELRVSASVGVSFFPQAESSDADYLLRQADQAMYQAKQTGKNRYHFFDTDQDQAVRGQHEKLERIREALTNREFVLYYQPKTNLRTGEAIGAEALIRWQHPELGLLPPADFLPIIENDDLIKQVGDWVIESALWQMEQWRQQGYQLAVSVNVAGRQLQCPEFLGKLKVALFHHPEVAHQLELEVLETSALEDIEHVSKVIQDCIEMGVNFALDDFGTGYSSLIYLKRLPAKTLKIDQSFVRNMLEDPDDLAILHGVLGLSNAFQRTAIAEGVESPEHIDMLLRLGCIQGQGYAIARPMPADKIIEWLNALPPKKEPQAYPSIDQDDLHILFAMVEHRAWVSSLHRHLLEDLPLPPMDKHLCRFGQWLGRSSTTNHRAHPSMPLIISVHERIHQEAQSLINLKNQGKLAAAQNGLSAITALRDELLELLQQLIRQH